MGIMEELIAKLPSKKFGGMTLYFDKDSKYVRVIECEGKYTYVLTATKNGKATHYIKTEINPGMSIDYKINIKSTWIIPEILNMDRMKEVEGRRAVDDIAKLLLDKVFQIVHYTILQDPKFKGSNFSESIVMVIVENPMGKRYAVPFLVGEGVHGCDEELNGSIMGEAYQFAPIGALSPDGKALHIDNLL